MSLTKNKQKQIHVPRMIFLSVSKQLVFKDFLKNTETV